ncbi:MAG: AbrB/MazE/SpoVT family DNA-binding domain-containing protein [Chloroflexota bacterium]|nr:AbrB/MazE/SpoVT family DNA-binding domain-containing protein [Chloroflexota bacterium]
MDEVRRHVRKVTTKGQVTIPAEVRELLGLKPHDKVVFRVEEGKVELQPTAMSLEDAFGSVTPLERPEDFKKLRDVAVEEHVQKVIDEMQE